MTKSGDLAGHLIAPCVPKFNNIQCDSFENQTLMSFPEKPEVHKKLALRQKVSLNERTQYSEFRENTCRNEEKKVGCIVIYSNDIYDNIYFFAG